MTHKVSTKNLGKSDSEDSSDITNKAVKRLGHGVDVEREDSVPAHTRLKKKKKSEEVSEETEKLVHISDDPKDTKGSNSSEDDVEHVEMVTESETAGLL
jgi:hypothetical protein